MPSHPKASVRHSPRSKVGKITTKAVPEPKNPKDVKKTVKDAKKSIEKTIRYQEET